MAHSGPPHYAATILRDYCFENETAVHLREGKHCGVIAQRLQCTPELSCEANISSIQNLPLFKYHGLGLSVRII